MTASYRNAALCNNAAAKADTAATQAPKWRVMRRTACPVRSTAVAILAAARPDGARVAGCEAAARHVVSGGQWSTIEYAPCDVRPV